MTETYMKMADRVGPPALSFSIQSSPAPSSSSSPSSSSRSRGKKIALGLTIFLLASGLIAYAVISRAHASHAQAVLSSSSIKSSKTFESTVGESGDVMGIFDKSGDITLYGRNLHWKASGYLKGLSWRYKADVTDKQSGTKGSASGFKSGKGAVEHATAECFKTMIAKGIIPPPPTPSSVSAGLDSLDEASLNAPQDPQQQQQQQQQQPEQEQPQEEEQPQQAAPSSSEEEPTVEVEVVVEEVPIEDDDEEIGIDEIPLILPLRADEIMNSQALSDAINEALDSSTQDFSSVYTITTLDQDGETVQGGSGNSGDILLYGRQIHYQVSGGLKGLKWVYKATARDVATGVTGSSSGKQSGKGAVEWAIKDLFQKLASQGVVITPGFSDELSSSPSSSSSSSSSSLMSSFEESPLSLVFSRLSQPRMTMLNQNDNPFQALFSSITRFAEVMDGFHNLLTSRTTSKATNSGKKLIHQEGEEQQVQGIFDKSGDTVVYGRKIHWKASGYLKGLSWRYKADATDTATGITGHASGTKSGQGAVENATKDCFQKLIAGGYLTIPGQ